MGMSFITADGPRQRIRSQVRVPRNSWPHITISPHMIKSKLCYDRCSVGQSVVVSSTHLGLTARFLLLSDSCGFVDVERSLWREGGSAVYSSCWSSPVQSFFGLSPAGLVTIFYCLRFETPPTWRARSPCLYPQEQCGPVTSPGTGFPFRRLLRLAGLRWRYSNPPPRGVLSTACLSTIYHTTWYQNAEDNNF
jgi:hypothetical protein